jgi:hypothetical protein
MKFKLPRQILNPLFNPIIRAQEFEAVRPSKKFLQGMAKACEEIEKEGIPKRFVLKKVKGMGYGIFLDPKAKPIERGEVIAPYAGLVTFFPMNAADDSDYAFCLISDIKLSREEQKLCDPKRPFRPSRLYALDLDAVKVGNFTRFINHSDQPNVEAEMVAVPKNKFGLEPSLIEIVYVAKKKIRPGEQLLVCYEGEEQGYWNVRGVKPRPVTPRTFMLKTRTR